MSFTKIPNTTSETTTPKVTPTTSCGLISARYIIKAAKDLHIIGKTHPGLYEILPKLSCGKLVMSNANREVKNDIRSFHKLLFLLEETLNHIYIEGKQRNELTNIIVTIVKTRIFVPCFVDCRYARRWMLRTYVEKN